MSLTTWIFPLFVVEKVCQDPCARCGGVLHQCIAKRNGGLDCLAVSTSLTELTLLTGWRRQSSKPHQRRRIHVCGESVFPTQKTLHQWEWRISNGGKACIVFETHLCFSSQWSALQTLHRVVWSFLPASVSSCSCCLCNMCCPCPLSKDSLWLLCPGFLRNFTHGQYVVLRRK